MSTLRRTLRSMSTTTESCDHDAGVIREDVVFDSGGQRCDGWLYRPPGPGPHPCVVLAHGIGGIRSAALPDFATRSPPRVSLPSHMTTAIWAPAKVNPAA